MNNHADPGDPAAAAAAREVTRLNARVVSMRSELVRLLQEVVVAERRLDSNQAALLVEANAQLVVTALGAHAQAASESRDEARPGGLDALTGLPNRATTFDRVVQALSNAKRDGHRVALLSVDLNNFKQINATFGHVIGDRAIELTAQCLRAQVREMDTVGRLGGDEFLMLLTQIADPADAARVAEKVNAALGVNHRIGNQVVRLSASIGISVYPEDGEDAQTLLDGAGASMYLAKQHELGGHAFHADRTAQRVKTLPLPAAEQRRTHDDFAMAEHERRFAELREANEQLVLSALGAQELQAAAELARRQQTEMLAVLAQELANPFAPIRIAAAMLGRHDADQALLSRAQAIVHQQVEQLSRLISGLIEPMQAKGATLTLDRRRIDVADIVDDAVKGVRPAMNRRLQALEVRLPAKPLVVNADPALLTQVFANLLANATNHTHDGGRIQVWAEVTSAAVLTTVADNGVGMTPAIVETIFEPFVRHPGAHAGDEEGLGIGLTVVRAVVQAHGGSVAATSAGSGKGSQFVVSLPLAGKGADKTGD